MVRFAALCLTAVLCLTVVLVATLAALPDPQAATTEPAVRVGERVQFSDLSSGLPTTWAWDFNYNFLIPTIDSTRQNPTWTYSQPGLWAVRLEVCNLLGCDVRIRFIEVLPADPAPVEIFSDGFESGDVSRWVGAEAPVAVGAGPGTGSLASNQIANGFLAARH